jgi:hypothetical protein
MSFLTSLRSYALAPAVFSVLSAGCFADAFEDIASDIGSCISTTLFVGEPNTSESGRSALRGQSLVSPPPTALATNTREAFTLESEVELAYLPRPGGTLEIASAEEQCESGGRTFYDIELETGDAEETRTLTIRSMGDDEEDHIVIRVLRPTAIELSMHSETLPSGLPTTLCANVSAADGTKLFVDRSIDWTIEGGELGDDDGPCREVTPTTQGPLKVTVTVGGYAQTFDLTAT